MAKYEAKVPEYMCLGVQRRSSDRTAFNELWALHLPSSSYRRVRLWPPFQMPHMAGHTMAGGLFFGGYSTHASTQVQLLPAFDLFMIGEPFC